MMKISRVFMTPVLAIALLPLGSQMAMAGGRNVDAMVGGALGGVIGSIVGSQIGGRDGAVVGAGIGAIAGVAISANDDRGHGRHERVSYVDERCRDDYRGGHRDNYYRYNNYGHNGYGHSDYRGYSDRGYYADRGERGRHEDSRSRYYRD